MLRFERVVPQAVCEFVPAHPRTKLGFGAEHLHAGLIVMGLEYAALDVQRIDGTFKLSLLTSAEPRGDHSANAGRIRLRLVVSNGGECRFGIATDDGDCYQIGPAFFAKVGRWIGAKFGLYCMSPHLLDTTGHADFSGCGVTGIR